MLGEVVVALIPIVQKENRRELLPYELLLLTVAA